MATKRIHGKKQKGGFNKVEFFTAHLDTNGDLITSWKSHVCWKCWIEIAVIAVICTYPQEHCSCKPKIGHHIHRFSHEFRICLGGFLELKKLALTPDWFWPSPRIQRQYGASNKSQGLWSNWSCQYQEDHPKEFQVCWENLESQISLCHAWNRPRVSVTDTFQERRECQSSCYLPIGSACIALPFRGKKSIQLRQRVTVWR